MDKQQEKIAINIGPNDLEPQVCSCGCRIFLQGFTLNKVTKLVGQSQMVQIPVFFCGSCGKEFNTNNNQTT